LEEYILFDIFLLCAPLASAEIGFSTIQIQIKHQHHKKKFKKCILHSSLTNKLLGGLRKMACEVGSDLVLAQSHRTHRQSTQKAKKGCRDKYTWRRGIAGISS